MAIGFIQKLSRRQKIANFSEKIEKYKTTKSYVSSEFCSEKNHNKQIFAIFAPTWHTIQFEWDMGFRQSSTDV